MKKNKEKIICVFLVLLTILSAIYKLCLGVEADEQYLLSMVYKLCSNKELLVDFYEPHQFSAVFPYFLINLKYFFVPNTTADVLYLRLVGMIVQLFVSVNAFLYIKKENTWTTSVIISAIVFLFTPKFTYTPDYALQQYWCLIILVFMYLYIKKWDIAETSLAGITCACMLLAYPPMGILLLVFFIMMKKKWTKWDYFCSISLCFILPPCILVSKMGVSFSHLDNLFSDNTHNISVIHKFIGQWQTSKIQIIILLIFTLITIAIITIRDNKILLKYAYICLICTVVYSLYQLLYQKQIGFESKWIILGILLILISKSKFNRVYILPLLSMGIAFFSSNQGLLFFIRYGFIFLILHITLNTKNNQFVKHVMYFIFVFLLLNNFMINTNNFYSCLNKNEIKMTTGPLKNIYVDAKTACEINEFHQLTTGKTGSLMILGNNSILNAYYNGDVVCPTSQSTPYYNESILEYCKKAQVDSFYIEKNNTFYSISDEFKDYISNNYSLENDGDFGVLFVKNN